MSDHLTEKLNALEAGCKRFKQQADDDVRRHVTHINRVERDNARLTAERDEARERVTTMETALETLLEFLRSHPITWEHDRYEEEYSDVLADARAALEGEQKR